MGGHPVINQGTQSFNGGKAGGLDLDDKLSLAEPDFVCLLELGDAIADKGLETIGFIGEEEPPAGFQSFGRGANGSWIQPTTGVTW